MYVPLYPRESILTFNIGTLCSLPRDTQFSLENVRKSVHEVLTSVLKGLKDHVVKRFSPGPSFSFLFRAQQAPCGIARISKSIVWKCSTILPNHRSESCAKSNTIFFPLTFFSWFLLVKRCRLVTGLFWGAMDSFEGLFDVFYYILLVKAPVKLTKLTFCAQCVVKCPNLKISN